MGHGGLMVLPENSETGVIDARAGDFNSETAADFSNRLAQVVAGVRLRNAWIGH